MQHGELTIIIKNIETSLRQKVTYGDSASEIINPDNARNQPRADMVWTLKSELASERASIAGDCSSNYKNARHQQQNRPTGCSQKGKSA